MDPKLYVRDHQRITFAPLNRFILLGKNLSTPLFLTNNIKLDEIQTKSKWKIQIVNLHCISSFEGSSFIKICKIQPLLFSIGFYVSRYHYSQLFRTSINIICKKTFTLNFPFSMDSLKPSPPNGQNPLGVTNAFCWCSLDSWCW